MSGQQDEAALSVMNRVVMNRPAAFAAACSIVGMPVSLPFAETDIKLAAGARSFERGLDYLGAVKDLEISLRTEQKRKRNLMKILDQNGL